ncbi:polysaccharide lyase family 8 super-sandwich domain-containing protein [Nonomuraea phyllanthi]|uniref:polysaccharide lyase family 8 super-sandwich domain-containing protein n=1 Tax=Nonomuraea phyllanthi TaxID=2219224 RepID=UPI0018854B1B|nr:polysaccharide lyase family 8 super-sandwich domain-containing protein [Nonomuraea phyllanthi]
MTGAGLAEAAATVRARLVSALRAGQGTRTGPPASQGAWPALDADGTWPDLDYAGRDLAVWTPFEHLTRLVELARGTPGGRAGAGAGDGAEQAVRALDAWLRLDPICPNWWYNQLGVPRLLGDVALLLEPRLTAVQRDQAIRVLERATWERMTGQNLLWAAQVAIRRCLLAGDPDGLADAYRRVQGLAVPGPGEGIQADGSFHQHGAQLYSGGYGHVFAVETAALAALSAGTALALSGRALAVLAGYLLDGQRWMVHAGRYDITCMGRESSREGNAAQARELAAAARALASAGGPRADELRAFAGGALPPQGTRAFWRSDYLAVHRPTWSAAVKLSSTRTALSECCNDEGLRGRHLCDGVCHLWRGGDEYHELWPVQDWRHIPGTTAAYGADPLPTNVLGADTGDSPFAGVLSDGEYGVAAMHLKHDGVEARKAWFFFVEEFVALGAGISGGGDVPVHTTLDQTALVGEVRCLPAALHHNGVGYRFFEPVPVTVRAGTRSGRWTDINRSQSGRLVSADVLELWLDHGPRPAAATYAYVTIPGISPERLREPGQVTVLANTPDLQAVRHAGLGLVQAVFHQPGTLELPGGDGVTVDRPLLLQLGGASAVTAACPLAAGGTAAIGLRRDGAEHRLRLRLPDGPEAGATVTASPPGDAER